jgi:hypothetical protein
MSLKFRISILLDNISLFFIHLKKEDIDQKLRPTFLLVQFKVRKCLFEVIELYTLRMMYLRILLS